MYIFSSNSSWSVVLTIPTTTTTKTKKLSLHNRKAYTSDQPRCFSRQWLKARVPPLCPAFLRQSFLFHMNTNTSHMTQSAADAHRLEPNKDSFK